MNYKGEFKRRYGNWECNVMYCQRDPLTTDATGRNYNKESNNLLLENTHVLCRRPTEYLIISDGLLQLLNLKMPQTVKLPTSSFTSENGQKGAEGVGACPVLFHGVMYVYGSLNEDKQYAVFKDNKVDSFQQSY